MFEPGYSRGYFFIDKAKGQVLLRSDFAHLLQDQPTVGFHYHCYKERLLL